MEFDAEFYVTLGFLVFLCLLGYLGVHRMVFNALDARGKAIADELAQAAKLREEATALLGGGLHTVAVKRALGRFSARHLAPARANALLEAGADPNETAFSTDYDWIPRSDEDAARGRRRSKQAGQRQAAALVVRSGPRSR